MCAISLGLLRRAVGPAAARSSPPYAMFDVAPSLTRPRCPPGPERFYVGRRPGAREVYVVTDTAVEPLAHLGYQSAAAFDWGCATPGALELAYSLLTNATARQPTHLVCRAFCEEVVACLDHAGFVLCDGDIALWLMSALSAAHTTGPGPQHDHETNQAWRALAWLRARLRRT